MDRLNNGVVEGIHGINSMSAVSLLAICALWPIVFGVRSLALLITAVAGGFHLGFVSVSLVLAVLVSLCIDIAIFLPSFSERARQMVGVRFPGLLASIVCVSSAAFGFALLKVAYASGGLGILLGLLALLGALLPTLSVLVPHRMLMFLASLSTAAGVFIASGDLQFVLGAMVYLPAMLLVALLRSKDDREAEAKIDRQKLNNERARCLLSDYEKSGRGWFWETDRHGRIAYISDAAIEAIEGDPQTIIGQPLSSVICSPGSESGGSERTFNFHFSARTAFSDLAVRVARSEEERAWSLSGGPFYNEFGQFVGFRGHGTDLTEVRRSHEAVTQLARYDNLTGLANRLYIKELFEKALTGHRGEPNPCSLFLLDLDRFKQVNDTLGHPIGDLLLKQVSERLKRTIGDSGEVGRLGGDEFQVVLPGIISEERLADIARSVIVNLSHPYMVEGNQIVIGASVGIAVADGRHVSGAETLIRNADLALYSAKENGRGIWKFYSEDMHKVAHERRALEGELRAALQAGGMSVAYQAVVDVATETIAGFEALARWSHPVRGAISPAIFVPIAEESGLIMQLGEWVLRTACSDAASWPRQVRIAVNVSPMQFADPAFPAIVLNALAQSGLEPERLELEITESVFLDDKLDAARIFERLKGIGVRLALDDFGTGYSALGYLRTAPFDKIKIDQSFVRGAAQSGSANSAIIRSIVSLAEALNMETTAEGAETIDELELIRSLGCSHVQGYIYGKPVGIAEACERLAGIDSHVEPIGHKRSRENRFKVLRTIGIHHDGYCYPARIKNISPGGALIEGLWDVPAGTQFEVALGVNLKVRATARWSVQDRTGLQFDVPISLEKFRQSAPPQLSTGYPEQQRA
ncbi:EAL domain-containing protein [Blastomonas sp.]|uniref:EAL domain-containing protein n=1 Tax=Blastomonas sp. TaxID=1909299 RepID=UPI003919BFDE